MSLLRHSFPENQVIAVRRIGLMRRCSPGSIAVGTSRPCMSPRRITKHCGDCSACAQPQGPLHTALAIELEHLEYLEAQQHALDAELESYARSDQFRTYSEALCCLRGVKNLTALTLLCEIDDIRRFASPRALMAYFGLVPSEHSSGDKVHRGPITKAGNIHVRRLLVEAAWNNRHRTAAELILTRRRQGQPPAIVAIALKAQHRLYKRFWHLDQRKHRHVAITAVARELCGFIWAILNQLPAQHRLARATWLSGSGEQPAFN